MKEQNLIYKGYKNNEYCFVTIEGKPISFRKTRSDLIEEYKLSDNTNINVNFLAKYFVNFSQDDTVYILSDLSIY